MNLHVVTGTLNWPGAQIYIPGVGFMVSVAGLGSLGQKFNSRSTIELIAGGVDSASHPSEVGTMSTSLLGWLSHLSILRQSGDPSRIVPNSPGDYFGSIKALYKVWSQWNGHKDPARDDGCRRSSRSLETGRHLGDIQRWRPQQYFINVFTF